MNDARALLGKQVRVTLSRPPNRITIAEGQLLGFSDGGDFEILQDDGFVHYCWPMLDIEATDSEMPHSDDCGCPECVTIGPETTLSSRED